MNNLFNATKVSGKAFIYHMLTSDYRLVFDAKEVCTKFILRAFPFILDLQVSIKEESMNKGCPKMRSSAIETKMVSVSIDRIVTFLRRLASETGDTMSETDEHHLPF